MKDIGRKTNQDQTQIILDSIVDGVFTVDSDLKITTFNRAAEKITGIRKEQALGRHCWEVFRASICEHRCALKETMKTGQQIVNQSIFIVNLEGDRVPISVSTALLKDPDGRVIGGVETFRDLSLVEELRKELSGRHSFFDIISKNKEMQRLFNILEQVSESNTTVLLEGESGTGKELFAKAIHSLSPRKNGPLVTVNCGSLPDTLLESELFGYKAGAFTDARKDKPGRLALAEGGTLFLDEIGDVSPALQVRLLRVLQDRVYEPLGSTRPETADVRIVAATNKNLDELVKKGVFRKDLYYRINVVKLLLPPLRKRKEDIPLLAEHFIKKFNRLNNREIHGLSLEALQVLMSHDFPGNVRELENILEYASVVCRNHYVGIEHLPDYLFPASRDAVKGREGGKSGVLSWDAMQRELITQVLRINNWNRKAAAAQLGIHPTTLWRKTKRLDIRIPGRGGQERL
ncbi:MAG: sigma 54-interacting transcriptional regulator [Deltaproteobacteria bacterium]|nr:sigma 54-interacting transcriptional regulator [Deltaproteobacteria bacterium]